MTGHSGPGDRQNRRREGPPAPPPHRRRGRRAARRRARRPAARAVQVINDAGAVVGADLTGNDAIDAALARIRTGALARPDDTRPWRVVVGAGTYGDVVLDEPNLTLLPSAGAAVTITTSVGADHTGGECLDVTRGNVTVQGIACRSARDRGIEVATPPTEGGVVLRQVTVDRAHSDGIAVIGGAGATIADSVVTNSGRDGITPPEADRPGAVDRPGRPAQPQRRRRPRPRRRRPAGAGDRGDDRQQPGQRRRERRRRLDRPRRRQRARWSRTGATASCSGAAAPPCGWSSSTATGNGGYGVDIGRGSGFGGPERRLRRVQPPGRRRLLADARAGGVYGGIGLLDTAIDLPGEPRGVVVRAIPLWPSARASPGCRPGSSASAASSGCATRAAPPPA